MVAQTEKNEKFSSYGTVLEIKDAVLLDDGRFILSTLGVRRFRVFNKGEEVILLEQMLQSQWINWFFSLK